MIDRYKVNIVQAYHAGNWESPELINVKDPEGEFVLQGDYRKVVNSLIDQLVNAEAHRHSGSPYSPAGWTKKESARLKTELINKYLKTNKEV